MFEIQIPHNGNHVDRKIRVEIRSVYGEERIYPVCSIAMAFCSLLGQKTLTRDNIRHIKDIGFSISIYVPEPRSL